MLGSFLIMAGAMLAAGCGSSATAPPPTRSSGRPATVTASATPKQRAAASAKAILSSFVPPPSAIRLAKQPELPGAWGLYPTMGINSTTQVDTVAYWRANGQHDGAARLGEGTYLPQLLPAGRDRRAAELGHRVLAGPLPGVLPQREMNGQVYDAGSGITVMKAEAMVSWRPPRPPPLRARTSLTRRPASPETGHVGAAA
jgi:hypothetical protein